MPHEATAGIPSELIIGDTWKWTRSIDGHSAADGWELKYELRRKALDPGAVKTITADADGTDWDVSVNTATSGSYTAGTYRWAEYLEKDGERYTIDTGIIRITGVGEQSQAERMVYLLEDAIEQLVEDRDKIVDVNGRSVTRNDLSELRHELGFWRAELEQEQHPGRLGPQIAARMQAPGFVRGPTFPRGLT